MRTRTVFAPVCVLTAFLASGSGHASPSASADEQGRPGPFEFSGPAAAVMFRVHRGKESNFERAFVALREALVKSSDKTRRQQGEAWVVYPLHSTGPGAATSVNYLMIIDPAVVGTSYDPALLIDQEIPGARGSELRKEWMASVDGVTTMPATGRLPAR